VAGHSIVRKDIPPFVKAAREPMAYVGINLVGLQRRSFPQDHIETISKIYHILFVENHSTSKALELIGEKIPDGNLKSEIMKFVHGSRIGIIRRYSKNGVDDD
jgi:UDP-N-acetylglucosamine acyltransferase